MSADCETGVSESAGSRPCVIKASGTSCPRSKGDVGGHHTGLNERCYVPVGRRDDWSPMRFIKAEREHLRALRNHERPAFEIFLVCQVRLQQGQGALGAGLPQLEELERANWPEEGR